MRQMTDEPSMPSLADRTGARAEGHRLLADLARATDQFDPAVVEAFLTETGPEV
jgi:hypothetical protein